MVNRIFISFVIACVTSVAHGEVELIEFIDKDKWEAAIDSFETIDFADGIHGELIDDDYLESHGVAFSNAYYWQGFENDGWGFRNDAFVKDGVWVWFDEPKMWIATDHMGSIAFRVYDGSELLTTINFVNSGVGNFSGLILSEPFDAVFLHRESNSNTVWVDDLHFGTVIPTPGDLNDDGTVGVDDLLILLSQWGPCANCDHCRADLTGDCAVGVDDLLNLLNNWGE